MAARFVVYKPKALFRRLGRLLAGLRWRLLRWRTRPLRRRSGRTCTRWRPRRARRGWRLHLPLRWRWWWWLHLPLLLLLRRRWWRWLHLPLLRRRRRRRWLHLPLLRRWRCRRWLHLPLWLWRWRSRWRRRLRRNRPHDIRLLRRRTTRRSARTDPVTTFLAALDWRGRRWRRCGRRRARRWWRCRWRGSRRRLLLLNSGRLTLYSGRWRC